VTLEAVRLEDREDILLEEGYLRGAEALRLVGWRRRLVGECLDMGQDERCEEGCRNDRSNLPGSHGDVSARRAEAGRGVYLTAQRAGWGRRADGFLKLLAVGSGSYGERQEQSCEEKV